MSLTLGGKTFFVPAAYAITKVINAGGTALPIFNVGVIIAKQMKGTPYTVGTGSTPVTADQFILPVASPADMEALFGIEGDNEGVTFLRYAKKTGAGTVYFLGVNPTTQLTGGVVQNATPANAITFASKDYGAYVNDTSLTIATSIHTIIPPKNTTFLTADSGTGATISVKSVKPFKVGDTVLVTSNAYAAPVSKVIQTIDAVNKTITFTTTIATSALKADYARIFQEDTDNQEVSTALTTPQNVIDFYATSKYLSAVPVNGISLMPVTLAKTYIQNLTSATKATSPDATATDWQNIADNFERWNEEFAIANKIYLRVLGLVTSDSGNHVSFRDLALSLRSKNKPIAIVAGCGMGDYSQVVGNAANPRTRSIALNSDDFQLAGYGLDGYAPYLSLAGEHFGMRLGNDINHNQTNDDIIASTVEKAYFKDDASLVGDLQAGVCAIKMTPTGYKVPQGISTYQDQTTTFNTSTKKTYLIMNRDLADFDLRAILELLDSMVGADGLTAQIVRAAVMQVSELMKSLGYIKSYTIVSITKSGNAFTVERQVAIDSPTDFFGLTNTIVVD